MNDYKLSKKWTFYIHLQNTNNWDLDSYYKIMTIQNVYECIQLNNNIGSELLKKALHFVMKDDIQPIWEDEKNKNGGCFSFKIHNKDIEQIWKYFYYRLIGNSLMKNKDIMNYVNGISLSPKKTFCILKVWMENDTYRDASIFEPIRYLDFKQCIFKKHIID